jgi:IPT/TIG domain
MANIPIAPPDLQGLAGTVKLLPQIYSVAPTGQAIGSSITITGAGFGATQGRSYVTIGAVQFITYASWSDTSIVCTVPAGAATGSLTVWV